MSTKNTKVIEAVTEKVVASKKPRTPKKVTGKVVGCGFLNIRDKASIDGAAICQIKDETVVEINQTESTDGWYKVTVGDVAGFCMKEFIEVK